MFSNENISYCYSNRGDGKAKYIPFNDFLRSSLVSSQSYRTCVLQKGLEQLTWMNKASRVCLFFFLKRTNVRLSMFLKAHGSPGGQKGQTNIWFASWLWGRNTSQADIQGIQNQTEALGVFTEKTGLFFSNNFAWWAVVQQSVTSEAENTNWKNVLIPFFCWDFSLSGDVLHRCPCLLWALLINKTRPSLGDLLLALKSVCVCVCVCVWVRGCTVHVSEAKSTRSCSDEWTVIRPAVCGS